jgi:hypothetical protein
MTKGSAVKEFTMSLGGLAGAGVAYHLHPLGGKVAGCWSPPHAVGTAHVVAPPAPALSPAVHAVHGAVTTQPPTVAVPWHCFSDGFISTLGPLVIGLFIGAVIGLPPTVAVPWHCFSDGFISTLGPLVIGLFIGAVIGLLVGIFLVRSVRAVTSGRRLASPGQTDGTGSSGGR